MNWLTALVVLASAQSQAEPPATARGVEIATARVTVEIVRPAVVRQNGGWQEVARDAPRPQVTRHDEVILVEYQ
jgi:hypothetical protein